MTALNFPARRWTFGLTRTGYGSPSLVAGNPTDNAYIESFHGTLRAECLDTH